MTSSEPVTQVELEQELRRMVDELLGTALDELNEHSVQASENEVSYKVAYAKAYIAAQGPVETRKALATIETEKQLFARLVEDRAVTTAREKLGALRTSIDAIRTMLVGLRQLT